MSYEPHTTTKEMSFVHRLGSHASYDATKCDRRTLLRRYIDAASKRADWGDIDRAAAVQFAQHELANEATSIVTWARAATAGITV